MRSRTVSFLIFASVLQGCVYSTPYMQPSVRPISLRPAPDKATVVFLRPSSFAPAMGGVILDDRGRYIGDAVPASAFAVRLSPGPHIFIVWAENTAAVQANLAAGRTYFVEMSPRPGFFSARMQLIAITQRARNWDRLGEWLASTEPHIVDHAGGQAYLDSRPDDVAERIQRAREHLAEYNARETADRVLMPEDGIQDPSQIPEGR